MPLDIQRIRALCFDVDGTLSDTDDKYVARLAAWLKPLRRAIPSQNPSAFARRVVMAVESPANFLYGIPDRLGFDDHLAQLTDWVFRHASDRPRTGFWIIPGVEAALQTLAADFPMAIISARGASGVHGFLHEHRLAPYFSVVATAHTCRHTKPYPDPLIWAAEQLGVTPRECLMIGDTTVDVGSGVAAGAQTVAVLSGFGQEDELRRKGADLVLPSVADLPDILLKERKKQTNIDIPS